MSNIDIKKFFAQNVQKPEKRAGNDIKESFLTEKVKCVHEKQKIGYTAIGNLEKVNKQLFSVFGIEDWRDVFEEEPNSTNWILTTLEKTKGILETIFEGYFIEPEDDDSTCNKSLRISFQNCLTGKPYTKYKGFLSIFKKIEEIVEKSKTGVSDPGIIKRLEEQIHLLEEEVLTGKERQYRFYKDITIKDQNTYECLQKVFFESEKKNELIDVLKKELSENTKMFNGYRSLLAKLNQDIKALENNNEKNARMLKYKEIELKVLNDDIIKLKQDSKNLLSQIASYKVVNNDLRQYYESSTIELELKKQEIEEKNAIIKKLQNSTENSELKEKIASYEEYKLILESQISILTEEVKKLTAKEIDNTKLLEEALSNSGQSKEAKYQIKEGIINFIRIWNCDDFSFFLSDLQKYIESFAEDIRKIKLDDSLKQEIESKISSNTLNEKILLGEVNKLLKSDNLNYEDSLFLLQQEILNIETQKKEIKQLKDEIRKLNIALGKSQNENFQLLAQGLDVQKERVRKEEDDKKQRDKMTKKKEKQEKQEENLVFFKKDSDETDHVSPELHTQNELINVESSIQYLLRRIDKAKIKLKAKTANSRFFSFLIDNWQPIFCKILTPSIIPILSIDEKTLTLKESKAMFAIITFICRKQGSKSNIWYGNFLNRKFNKEDFRRVEPARLLERAQKTHLQWLNADASKEFKSMMKRSGGWNYVELLNQIGNNSISRELLC